MGIGDPEHLRDVFREFAKPPLALAEGLFGTSLFGDVVSIPDHAQRLSGFLVEENLRRFMQDAFLAIRPQNPVDHRILASLADGINERLPDRIPIVRMHEAEENFGRYLDAAWLEAGETKHLIGPAQWVGIDFRVMLQLEFPASEVGDALGRGHRRLAGAERDFGLQAALFLIHRLDCEREIFRHRDQQLDFIRLKIMGFRSEQNERPEGPALELDRKRRHRMVAAAERRSLPRSHPRVVRDVVANVVNAGADGGADSSLTPLTIENPDRNFRKIAVLGSRARHHLRHLGVRIASVDGRHAEQALLDGDAADFLRELSRTGDTHDHFIGPAEDQIEPVEAGQLFLRHHPVGDVDVHHNGPGLAVLTQRGRHHPVPAPVGGRMAGILHFKGGQRSIQHAAQAGPHLMRLLRAVADCGLTRLQIIVTEEEIPRQQGIDRSESPPTFVHREDKSMPVDQGDVRRQRILDCGLGFRRQPLGGLAGAQGFIRLLPLGDVTGNGEDPPHILHRVHVPRQPTVGSVRAAIAVFKATRRDSGGDRQPCVHSGFQVFGVDEISHPSLGQLLGGPSQASRPSRIHLLEPPLEIRNAQQVERQVEQPVTLVFGPLATGDVLAGADRPRRAGFRADKSLPALFHVFHPSIRHLDAVRHRARLAMSERRHEGLLQRAAILRVDELQELRVAGEKRVRIGFKNPMRLRRPGDREAVRFGFPTSDQSHGLSDRQFLD